MPKYRLRLTKILEDGTELEISHIVDDPWYLSPILKDLAKRIHLPMPPPNFPGQGELFRKAA